MRAGGLLQASLLRANARPLRRRAILPQVLQLAGVVAVKVKHAAHPDHLCLAGSSGRAVAQRLRPLSRRRARAARVHRFRAVQAGAVAAEDLVLVVVRVAHG